MVNTDAFLRFLQSITSVAAEVGAWRGLLMYVDSHICKWDIELSEGHKRKKNPGWPVMVVLNID